MNHAFKTKLVAGLFVPALAVAAAGTAWAAGDNKVTGQAATNGSTNAAAANTTTGDTAKMGANKATSTNAAFAKLDTNHDGKLSASEGAADPKVKAMWKKLDTNNDGTVSEAEFAAHQAELK